MARQSAAENGRKDVSPVFIGRSGMQRNAAVREGQRGGGKPARSGSMRGQSAAQKERRRGKGAQRERKGSAKAEIFIRFSKSCRRTLIKYDILDKSVLSGAKEIFGRIYGKENNRV